MLDYITTAAVELHAGRIRLSDDQAGRGRRLKNLARVQGSKGVYEIQGSVQFKAGETIGLDQPDKATLAKLTPTSDTLKKIEAREQARIDRLAREKADQISAEKMDQDLEAAARTAIDQGQVTQSGKPEVEAMEKILGYDITAAQRDAAWQRVQDAPAADTDSGSA